MEAPASSAREMSSAKSCNFISTSLRYFSRFSSSGQLLVGGRGAWDVRGGRLGSSLSSQGPGRGAQGSCEVYETKL